MEEEAEEVDNRFIFLIRALARLCFHLSFVFVFVSAFFFGFVVNVLLLLFLALVGTQKFFFYRS